MPKAAKLDDYLTELYRQRRKTPAILIKTDYSVEIVSGLALVEVTRRFRNDEASAIEAVMTFPVPFNAAVTRLEAEVDGRKLVGVTSAKAQARETYENAIDDGKSAVLHEELLPGIHMVSVANVRPQSFIDVKAHFVVPLSAIGDAYKLRIPLTVGQVYGNSPLMNADALVSDGPEQSASVNIFGQGENFLLNGNPFQAEQTVSLGSVIEITMDKKKIAPVSAAAKDGRLVTISFGKMEVRDEDLEFDVLLDASGSMADADASGKVKWSGMIEALGRTNDLGLRDGDKINLWTFSTRTEFVKVSSKASLAADLRAVHFTKGSTELQDAIERVSASREAANILILTDGKAWHLDFAKAIQNGARVTVVLMGSEALEAKVGYLAAMSGGQLFTCFGPDTGKAIAEAVRSMRGVSEPVVTTQGRPGSLSRSIGGMTITAEWKVSKTAPKSQPDGVSQYAAYLAIAGMPEDKATAYAVEEGIVTHLTSIALVDEAGEAVQGVPAQRKVPLSAPSSGGMALLGSGAMRGLAAASKSMLFMSDDGGGPVAASYFAGSAAPVEATRGISVGSGRSRSRKASDASPSQHEWTGGGPNVGSIIPRVTSERTEPNNDIRDLMEAFNLPSVTPPSGWSLTASLKALPIDWDKHADALSKADVNSLPLPVRARIRAISDNPAVIVLAGKSGRTNIELAIGLIAYVDKANSKTADRIQRRFLRGVGEGDVQAILATI